MARVGRFGRLPTEAPDLSSQIVSMMEQYAAARDRNILDAWTNGGKFEGKRVTDQRILRYYRQRRNEYEKDDPEYDQWSQDLWQLRYQIADEKVNMAYRNGKIGPRAVARHYQRWARKMPKNSSFYRNLMAAAGDFLKSTAAGRASSSRGSGYASLQRRIAELDRQQRESNEYIFALDEYARRKGYIGGDQSMTDPSVIDAFEAADFQMLIDGAYQDPKFKNWARGMRAQGFRTFDEETFSREDIISMENERIRIAKKKIRAYQGYGADMSSYIIAERKTIRSAKARIAMVRKGGYIDTQADVALAMDIFLGQRSTRTIENGITFDDGDGWGSATSPSEAVEELGDLHRAFAKASRRLDRFGGQGEYALFYDVMARVTNYDPDKLDPTSASYDPRVAEQALRDAEFVRELNPDFASDALGGFFNSPEQIMNFMQDVGIARQGQRKLADRTGVLYYPDQPTSGEMALGASANLQFIVLDAQRDEASGKLVLRDPYSDFEVWMSPQTAIFPQFNADGGLDPVLVEGTPVTDDGGAEIGIVWKHNGVEVWGQPDPSNPGTYLTVPYNPHEFAGQSVRWENDRVVVGPGPEGAVGSADRVIMGAADALQQSIDMLDLENIDKDDLDVVQSGLDAGDTDVISETPEGRRVMRAMLPEVEQMLDSMWGTGGYDMDLIGRAERAVYREIRRRRLAEDIEFTEEDALFITAGGQMRHPDDVQMAIFTGTSMAEEAQTRNDIIADAVANGIEPEQALQERQQVEQMTPTLTGAMNLAFPQGTFTQTTDTVPGGAKGEALGIAEAITGGTTYSQANVVNAAKFLVDALYDSGFHDPSLTYVVQSPEHAKAFVDDPSPYIEMAIMNVSDERNATLMFEDYATLLTYKEFEPALAKVYQSGALEETERGRMLGLSIAFDEARDTVGQWVEDFSGGWLDPFAPQGPEGALGDRASNFPIPTAADAGMTYAPDSGVPRSSELSMTPRARVVEDKPQPTLKVTQTIAGTANLANVQPLKTRTQMPQFPTAPVSPSWSPAPTRVSAPTTPSASMPNISVPNVKLPFGLTLPTADMVATLKAEVYRAKSPYTFGTGIRNGQEVDTVQGNGVSGWR